MTEIVVANKIPPGSRQRSRNTAEIVDDEAKSEDKWFSAVYAKLMHDKPDVHSALSWSAFHAETTEAKVSIPLLIFYFLPTLDMLDNYVFHMTIAGSVTMEKRGLHSVVSAWKAFQDNAECTSGS